jgi:hypothetical protein
VHRRPRAGRLRDPAQGVARYLVRREEDRDLAREEASGESAGPGPAGGEPAARPTEAQLAEARARRVEQRALWVDRVVDQAIARGEFDDNPWQGKPLPGIDGRHDPDWWVKALVEREHLTGVLPEALQLRKDDAALRDALDRERSADAVRARVTEFNGRVVEARRQLRGGPPVVTDLRDVEAEVAAWRERRGGA